MQKNYWNKYLHPTRDIVVCSYVIMQLVQNEVQVSHESGYVYFTFIFTCFFLAILFFLLIMLKILLKVSIFCSKLGYISS